MKLKLKRTKKPWKATLKALKHSKPVLRAASPILLDVVSELLPASTTTKAVIKIGKSVLS